MRVFLISLTLLATLGYCASQTFDDVAVDVDLKGMTGDTPTEVEPEDDFLDKAHDQNEENEEVAEERSVPSDQHNEKLNVAKKWSYLHRSFRNCHEVKAAGHRYSGLYYIQTNIGKVKVYCEMSIARGVYTFIPRNAVLRTPMLDLGPIAGPRPKKVLLRFQATDTTQPWTVLQQLPQYAGTPLHLNVDVNPGYATPQNRYKMDCTYIYLGFLSKAAARNHNVQGFTSNGQQLKFKNCDKNPNSYFAFFPNHFEKTPSNFGKNWKMWPLTNNWIKSGQQPFSHRTMPNEFFFFTENAFGGCGSYWQSNRRYSTGATGYARQVEGVAIGV